MLRPQTALLVTTLVLLGVNVPHMCQADVAPISEFCSLIDCPEPRTDVVGAINSQMRTTFGPGPAKCGDGVCHISLGETCQTCPSDCGRCKLAAPLTKCKHPNQMALTFDDGPSDRTAAILKILREYDIKATFFVNGIYLLGKELILQQIMDDEHIIGSHTYSHRSLDNGHTAGVSGSATFSSLELSHLQGELLVNDALIYGAIGKLPLLIRPPFLEYSSESMAYMDTAGYTAVNINVDTNDWRVSTASAVLDNLQDEFGKCGDNSWIHLQHDPHAHSVQALPSLIEYLKEQGVTFVTLDQCLGVDAYRKANDSPFLARPIQDKVKSAEVTASNYDVGLHTPPSPPRRKAASSAASSNSGNTKSAVAGTMSDSVARNANARPAAGSRDGTTSTKPDDAVMAADGAAAPTSITSPLGKNSSNGNSMVSARNVVMSALSALLVMLLV